eukprot:gnl/TRDRNA2_/TRDRNA2_33911_c0_seq1.p1 gnl/TRDRNA2_/TRDRNA2_33911_c0~~gnl/TRDRNA2_/TRDRNA2_33911_c0_seq1.p1  ORF type:complete len:442 (+),score=91.50 gnl/TRDRNA2_/TRDRNA2_33911_c0_seq1:75-1400(+)
MTMLCEIPAALVAKDCLTSKAVTNFESSTCAQEVAQLPVAAAKPSIILSLPGSPPKCQTQKPKMSALQQRRRASRAALCISSSMAQAEDSSTVAPTACVEGNGTTTSRVSDRYTVLELLGSGTTGVVQRAKRKEDDMQVALKTLRTDDSEFIRIAEAEFSLLRGIEHPNIIRAYDFFTVPGQAVLVLELFEGPSLQSTVRRAPEKRLSEDIAQPLAIKLLKAVDHLHQNRIVHRDIKPQNVLVSKDLRELKLIDFNTARSLLEGGALTMTGTQLYAAPEVLMGESPSEASDVWAAGVCIHFMLSGALPQNRDKSDLIPSNETTAEEARKAVANRHISFNMHCWQLVSKQCKAALQQMLATSKSSRPAAMTLLAEEHWFLGSKAYASSEAEHFSWTSTSRRHSLAFHGSERSGRELSTREGERERSARRRAKSMPAMSPKRR